MLCTIKVSPCEKNDFTSVMKVEGMRSRFTGMCYNPKFVSDSNGTMLHTMFDLLFHHTCAIFPSACTCGWSAFPCLFQADMKEGVMEYEAQKLKELSAYLGEKHWFAGETVHCGYLPYRNVLISVIKSM